jgi:Uma2 family endonuclease
MTVEEYLAFEERSQTRHEYLDGQVFVMTGAKDAHNVINVNLTAKLHSHLQGTGCRVYSSDMKVHVKACNSFYYPDLIVTCEPVVADSVFKTQPRLIIEILSRSTATIDRREKLVNYRKLDSLCEYVLIAQHKMYVELHRKDADGTWSVQKLGRSDELVLESFPNDSLRIGMYEIYEGLDVPSRVEEEEEEYDFTTA